MDKWIKVIPKTKLGKKHKKMVEQLLNSQPVTEAVKNAIRRYYKELQLYGYANLTQIAKEEAKKLTKHSAGEIR